jgi:hypothetical protein
MIIVVKEFLEPLEILAMIGPRIIKLIYFNQNSENYRAGAATRKP